MQKKDLEKQYNMRISPNEYEEIKSLGHNHLKVKLDEIWKNRIEPSEPIRWNYIRFTRKSLIVKFCHTIRKKKH